MQVLDSFLDAMGDTPLVRLHAVTRGLRPTVLAKLEMLNPGGSVKDRIGIRMIEAAEREGKLRPGGTIVEPTSGNTGHGLAIAAAVKGYDCIFVMPDKMSQEKIALLRAYGAEVVICPTAVARESPESYYSVADRLASEIPGAFQPNQYFDPALVDRWVRVPDREAFLTARAVPRQEGILIGGSGGSAVAAALTVARDHDEDATIVVLLPDTGRQYLSKLFSDSWMRQYGFLEG